VSDNKDEGDFTYEFPHTAYKRDANMADAVAIGEKMSAPTELYDSGCTPASLTSIPPKEFSAANNQRFMATACGNLAISVPNETTESKMVSFSHVTLRIPSFPLAVSMKLSILLCLAMASAALWIRAASLSV
jgi:hypothetical protein